MLNGTTVLVVEEEFLIALDIQRMLENLDVDQVIFARSVEEAQGLKSLWHNVGLAIVEVAFHRDQGNVLIDTLLAMGIFVILCSADSALRNGLEQFPNVPVVCKPMAESDLVQAISLALSSRCQNE